MRIRAALLMMAGLLLAGCGGLGGAPAIMATLPPVETAAPEQIESAWQPDIANGARIFAQRCVDCHGERGDGRGELVLAGSVEQPLDMTDFAAVAAKSPLEWFEIITEGRIANLMPPWEAALSESERWDVTLYAISLAYDEALLARGERVWREKCGDCALPSQIPPIYGDRDFGAKLNRDVFGAGLTDAEAGAAAAYARMQSLTGARAKAGAARGELRGFVVHGTAGGVLPADTSVQLRYGNGESGYRVLETRVGADFSFRFDDVPISTDLEYALGAAYAGRLFSRIVSLADFAPDGSPLTLKVYDETHDAFVISIARIDLYLAPATLEDWGAGVYVSQILTYRNSSDRLYTSGRGFDDGREAALLIQFPRGARLLSGDGGGRFVVIEDMESLPDSVIDTNPVMPGEIHSALLEYWLPYDEAARFEQTFNNPIDAKVTLAAAEGLRIESDWLREEPDGGAAEDIAQYSADLRLERAPRLSFGLSGDPFATSSDDRLVITSDALPALLIGALLAAAGALAGFGLMKRRGGREGAPEIDGLARQLAQLEADHDQGRINHDLYHHRRRELQARLAALMDESQ